MKTVIGIVGGGSVNWCPGLIRDVYHIDALEGGEIRLLDPDDAALRLIASLEGPYNRLSGKEFKFIPVHSLDECVSGADFTLCTFSPGSLDAFYWDLEVPIPYGVRQPVSMTAGPCGISAALRTCSVAHEVGQAVSKHAPGSWIINVVNPLTCVTRAINLGAPNCKVVGLCHELEGQIGFVGDILGVPWPEGKRGQDYLMRDFDLQVAGLNHFIWLTRIFTGGKDRYPELRAFAESHEAWFKGGDPAAGNFASSWSNNKEAKLALCKAFGSLPMAGDRHLVEFMPSMCSQANRYAMDYGIRKTTMRERYELKKKATERVQRWVSGEEDIPWRRSSEQATDIIETVLTKGKERFVMNVPNRGQIAELPSEVVVESISTLTADGFGYEAAGPLPQPIAGICRSHVEVQELAVQAALEGNRRKLLDALYLDHHTHMVEFREIPRLADELLEANRDLLPRFFPA
jgi:alpha-galactosidase/6-phospho-beta-glucosidase family protein